MLTSVASQCDVIQLILIEFKELTFLYYELIRLMRYNNFINNFSNMTSKPNDFCWIRTGSKPNLKITNRILTSTKNSPTLKSYVKIFEKIEAINYHKFKLKQIKKIKIICA